MDKDIRDISLELNDSLLTKVDSFDSFVYVGEKYVYKKKKSRRLPSKESVVLDLLNDNAPDENFFPRVQIERQINDCVVTVVNRIEGQHPTELSPSLVSSLAKRLMLIHSFGVNQEVTEFESSGGIAFFDYYRESLLKYSKKLKTSVDSKDGELISEASRLAFSLCDNLGYDPELSLIHKDIFSPNLLVSGNIVTGIVDWDSAQLSPREWELAILRQRFPESYSLFLDCYSVEYDPVLVDICGIIQSLRFWKSFPHQKIFVDIQRATVEKILGSYV